MWDFDIGHALALMGRTLPFILLRIAVYAGIAIAYVLATGMGAGLGWAIGGVGGPQVQGSPPGWGAGIRLRLRLLRVIPYWLFAPILYLVPAGPISLLLGL